MIAEKDRFRSLDGLRGLAALIVVFHHFVTAFRPEAFFRGGAGMAKALSETPLLVLINGPFAVFVFFVLSGYVLAGGRGSALTPQIIARYVRLAVPAGASVVLAYAIFLLGMSHVEDALRVRGSGWLEERLLPGDYPWWKAMANIAGSYFITGNSSLNSVLWTMRTELFGSITVFVVSGYLANATVRTRVYLALCLVGLALSASKEVLYLVPFFAGALMRESGLRAALTLRPLCWTLLAAGFFLGGTPYENGAGTVYEPLANAVGALHRWPLEVLRVIGAILLVVSVVRLRIRLLETRLADWLGRISFSSYLVHLLLLFSLAAFVFGKIGPQHLLAQGCLFVATTLAAAALFHRYVEVPAIDWSRRIKSGTPGRAGSAGRSGADAIDKG